MTSWAVPFLFCDMLGPSETFSGEPGRLLSIWAPGPPPFLPQGCQHCVSMAGSSADGACHLGKGFNGDGFLPRKSKTQQAEAGSSLATSCHLGPARLKLDHWPLSLDSDHQAGHSALNLVNLDWATCLCSHQGHGQSDPYSAGSRLRGVTRTASAKSDRSSHGNRSDQACFPNPYNQGRGDGVTGCR